MITAVLAGLIVLGEWTGLARGILGVPVFAALLDVALLGLAGTVALGFVRRRELPRLSILMVLIGAYMALALIEIFNPNVPSLRAGVEGYRKTAFTMLAFFIVVLSGELDAGRFFRIVALGSIPTFIWAARQFISPLAVELNIISSAGTSPISFHSGQVLRAFAPTAGPFHLGILGGAILIVAVMLAASRGPRWLLVAALAGMGLGLSITRANMVGLIVACAVLAVAASPMRERLRTAVLAVGPVGVALVSVLFAVGALAQSPGASPGAPLPGSSTPPHGTTVGNIISTIEDPTADKSLQFRFSYWQDFAAAVREQPLIGYGTSAAADGFDHFYAGTGSTNFEPHSLYFKAALELGIGGLALLLGIFASLIVAIVRGWRFDRITAPIMLGTLTLVAVSGITGPMLDAYPVNLLFWSMCGWAAVAARTVGAGRPGPAALQPSGA
jgi:O-antigen ligase